MKIDDLIKPKIRKFNNPKNDSFWINRFRKQGQTRRRGSFSFVNQVKNDPHQIMKKTKTPLGNRGLDLYIQYVLENQNHNPFLPRIYDVVKIKTEHGTEVADYKMEKLFNWEVIPSEILFSYLNSLFIFKREYDDNDPDTRYQLEDAAYILADQEYEFIRSKLLQKTIKEIIDLSPTKSIDTNTENLMFRTGKQGLQLVLADPIGYVDADHRNNYKSYVEKNKNKYGDFYEDE